MTEMNSAESNPESLVAPESPATVGSAMLGVFIILLMLWPFAHRKFVRECAINPWQLFGAAMYCTNAPSSIEILGYTPQTGMKVIKLSELKSESLKREFLDYGYRRHHLGLLAGKPPVSIAEGVFKERHDLADVLIRTRSNRLDPETGTLKPDLKAVYHFRFVQGTTILYDQDIETDLIYGPKKKVENPS